MNYYLAPMEGITGYVYRNAYHNHFAPFDKYFTPFVAPTRKASLSSKEKNDILPAHNAGIPLVPQILSNNSKLFILCAQKLYGELGYSEINLNLGCPSATVVTKNKGAGFLAVPDRLKQFLDDIFSASDMPAISIKTRIGMEDTEEFERILAIYNEYPLTELIVHPRLQKEMYRGTVHMDVFREAITDSKAELCYNGDIGDEASFRTVKDIFPSVDRVMMGRGVLQNPFLLEQIKGEDYAGRKKGSYNDRLQAFHDDILEGYLEIMPGEMPTLFKMKELWVYLFSLFDFSSDRDKIQKKIKKAGTVSEYRSIANVALDYPICK